MPTFDEYRTRAVENASRLGQKQPELSEAQWRMGYEDHRTSLLDALDGALKAHLLQSGSISAYISSPRTYGFGARYRW